MKCNNCGKDNSNGAMFCESCGAFLEVKENNGTQQNDVNYQNSACAQQQENGNCPPDTNDFLNDSANVYDNANQTNVGSEQVDGNNKKKRKKRMIIAAAIAGVLAVVITLDFLIFGNIKNFFINIGPADNHLSYVYTNVAENIGAELAETYGTVFFDDDGMETNGTLKVEVNEEILSMLGSDEIVSALTNANVDFTVARDADNVLKCGLKLDAGAGLTENVDLYLDIENGKFAVDMPGISNEALMIDFGDQMPKALSSFDLSFLPDEDFIEDVIPSIIEAAFDAIEDVEREDREFTAGGVSEETTCLILDVDTGVIADMLVAALDEIEENEDITDVISDFVSANEELVGADASDVVDAWEDILSEGKKAINSLYAVNQDICTIYTYVNFDNDIVALEVETDAELGKATFFMGVAEDGDDMGFEISLKAAGQKMFALAGDGTVDGDMFDGEIIAESMGKEFVKIDVKQFDLDSLEDGYVSGIFKISLGEALCEEMGNIEIGDLNIPASDIAVEIEIKTSEENFYFSIAPSAGGTELGRISIDSEIVDEASVSMPSNVTTDANDFDFSKSPMFSMFELIESSGIQSEINNLEDYYEYEEEYETDAYYDYEYGY